MADIKTMTDREYWDMKKLIEMLVDEYKKDSDSKIKDQLKKIVSKLMLDYEQNRDTEYLIDMIKDHVTL